jgi:hypothetical protein
MKRNRFLPVCVVLVATLGLVQGCSRGPSEEELKLVAFQEQYATLQQQVDALNQLRSEIDLAKLSLAELEAIDERKRTDEQKAEIEELAAKIESLTVNGETAFEEVQSTLADFLFVGINDYPESAETAAGLKVYSDEAILVAEDMVVKAGEYKKAIDHLRNAEGYFEAAGLPPDQPLVDKIAILDDWRFVTEERFALVKNGMTKDEVVEAVGPVYYGNIQVSDAKGVETWLYKKREGGAAAIYFKMKTGKVYNKKFDAVAATTVVND